MHRVLLALFVLTSFAFSQERADTAFIVARKDSLFLRVVTPERDTLRTPSAK